ncbi:MAG: ComF family protein [Candidatus Babeliaceae bacterium]|nr:ComF family protein [Candidatus Babeliaceae bacterium]
MQIVSDFLKTILSPPFCIQCHTFLTERTHLCSTCIAAIKPVFSYPLEISKTRDMPIYALSIYDGIIRSLIIAKHHGSRTASTQLGDLIADHLICPWQQYDCLVPVPLHWTRYAKRGFNQAKIIAQKISAKTGLPIHELVYRSRKTAYQTSVDKNNRIKNVSGAFCLRREATEQFHNARFLIVDDLMTTGATLRAIARTLNPCEPLALGAVVAARVS